MRLSDIFRGNIIDVTDDAYTVELTGTSDKLNARGARSRPVGAPPDQTFDAYNQTQLDVKPRRNSDSQFFRRRQRPRHRAMQVGEYDDSASDTSPTDPRRNSDSHKFIPRVRPRRRMSEGQAYSLEDGGGRWIGLTLRV